MFAGAFLFVAFASMGTVAFGGQKFFEWLQAAGPPSAQSPR